MNEQDFQTLKAIEGEKEALVNRISSLNRKLRYKQYEQKALSTLLQGIPPTEDVRFLRRKLNDMEFRIATESTNLKQEREMMKRIKLAEAEYQEAMKSERMRRKLSYVEGDIKQVDGEIAQLDVQIKEKRQAIRELQDKMRTSAKDSALEHRKIRRIARVHENKKHENEETRKEMEPFTGKFENTVTLESICVIKRKKKSDGAEVEEIECGPGEEGEKP